jgi:hypothetical protein
MLWLRVRGTREIPRDNEADFVATKWDALKKVLDSKGVCRGRPGPISPTRVHEQCSAFE